ncbi:MAG: hypothetical protein BWZ01_02535 [Deltaproteobacteria bacterium ADurb.BinA179]|jgi:nucleotide-binding universal stress UspA family protein|nr:MAG: hypothetical protein BWZ01_02535 [Deltaproteobacteria bacterium ADurb.BinA179]HOD70103.1 universal stress protein [Deltaproteobacteria bacterium]HOE71573.1 universal stress protein [Deltaproteobacteria bacterium]HOS26681.1 universal stress protein [Deltaproteobacteria bacterium]HPL85699.1 universal stress protein [Deltaproteobacteria bacterium]
MFTPKKIVVATDFSEYADKALKSAVDIAERTNAEVYLVHVVDKIQQCVADYCIDEGTMRNIENQSLSASRDKMQKKVQELSRSRKASISFDVKAGVPYEEILKEQEEKDADLIVIASHGKTGILKHMTGSVADKVVHHARCPVLLVR